ncbi:MAG: glycosyltransferase family 4 protein [Desulfurococcaceae archaeon]
MNRPMRVVVFSERLWPEGGGGELATYLILKLLASTGDFELEVYTGTEGHAKIPGASVRVVDLLRASNKIELFTKILANRRLVEKAVERADVVYIPRFSYPVIPVAKKLGKKVVVHLHDYQPVSYTSVIFSSEVERPMSDFKRTLVLERASKPLPLALVSVLATPLTKLIRKWVGIADKIICVSRRQEEIVLKLAPEYRGRTIVIYNPPPEIPAIEKSLSEKPTLLYVGGDSYVKGFHVLLQSLRILCEQEFRNLELLAAGNYGNKSLKILSSLKDRCDLRIKVLGHLSHEEVLRLHSKIWALVLPSISEETMSYATLEAALLGTLPVASRVGALPEVLSSTPAEAFLFRPSCPSCLADKIVEVTSMSREEMMALGCKLRRMMTAKFDRDVIKKMLVRVFEE